MNRKFRLIVTFLLLLCMATGCASKKNNCAMNMAVYNTATSSCSMTNAKADISYSLNDSMSYDMSEGQETLEEELLVKEYEDFNTEEYNAVVENRFQDTMTSPLSTFSADVDTASYSNIRRMILDGMNVDSGAVRIEEMMNYFHYDYETPKDTDKFSVTKELFDCPWNEESKLLMIGIKTQEIDLSNVEGSNFVFLLDVSGSMMSEDKLPLMIDAFILLTEQLSEKDRISIVTYAGCDEVVLSGASGEEKKKITDALENLTAGGSTNGSDGIITAYKLAEKYFIQGGNNRVILATDGDLNVGVTSESALKELIEEQRKSGIYLSVLGFGTGNIKDNKMETLADYGNGNYAYIDQILEAKKVLVEEMGGTLYTVAKDVKFQVEFNPAYVSEYRLIGYENRILADKDFNDDTKDAGEIGAGHCVTALYELKLAKDEVTSSKLKYQEVTLKDSDEWATIHIRYKEPEEDVSQLLTYTVSSLDEAETASEQAAFVACVAQFGMLLKHSEYAGNATYSSILDQLKQIDAVEQDDYKSEFRYLVEIMKRR